MAGVWEGLGPRTATWAVPPLLGDGSNAQGGNPPALAFEPEVIDENGNYVRNDWLNLSGNRWDNGEAKFRISCNAAYQARCDPLLFPGMVMSGHSHTFIGNKGLFEALGEIGLSNARYETLRQYPAATCSGGPLNGTLYWAPTLFFEDPSGIDLPVNPNIVSFYYTIPYTEVAKMFRILRGLTFIGGADPTDRFNTARLAEIPDGAGWDKTSNRLNGWVGWQANHPTLGNIPLDPSNTADANGVYARQLVNADGSDPWGGAAEDPEVRLIANMVAPSAWDGHNLRSPNGRDHFRYPIRKANDSYNAVAPQGWWKIPHFEVKEEFSNGRNGIHGHAWRSKLYLSSDRFNYLTMTGNLPVEDWHPRGSTYHFDWMNGWDSVVQDNWAVNCTGTTINGVPGSPLTCNTHTINDTQALNTGPSPDPSMSNDPIITFHDYSAGPSNGAFGPLRTGTTAPGGTVTVAQ